MWAEANAYWYRGVCVAKLKGGDFYTAPEIVLAVGENGEQVLPEPHGNRLRRIDVPAMVHANRGMMDVVEQTTVKRILSVYEKHKDRVDLFHAAFSGGKDSAVLLDLVWKTLPASSFVVIFGDTGMEFPDTYEAVRRTRLFCERAQIPFYTARSHMEPEQSWALFGPPSRVLRWCCSVHKSTPQTLKLREITGKDDYLGLAFVGVRAHESATRSHYDHENYGKKQKGQYSHNSILEWTSAEVWLYIFANDIWVNDAYKKGNSRAGCLVCPMSVNKADYIKARVYGAEVEKYLSLIRERNGRSFGANTYITKGGWVSRRSGRDLISNVMNYVETSELGVLKIKVTNPKEDWREWMKTLEAFGDIPYTIDATDDGHTAMLPEEFIKKHPRIGKLFKQVFRKSAYCAKCRACETNCNLGHLRFDPKLIIDGCIGCLQCHDIEDGCFAYNSLRVPKEEKTLSINSFDSTLPKNDWFDRFLSSGDDFWTGHGLGPNQLKTFKTFLRHSGLISKIKHTVLADLVRVLGWDQEVAWGIMLVNLVAENPQLHWYVTSFEVGVRYSRDTVIAMVLESNRSSNVAKFVYSAFAKLMELPLGTALRFGYVTDDGSIVRSKCRVTDYRVILYGLFKFAEKCNDFKEFTLATLLNDTIERDGVSPTRIFGLERHDMIPILLGLSAKYPEFISASFTHDLEKINLAADKSSSDVLELFREGTSSE